MKRALNSQELMSNFWSFFGIIILVFIIVEGFFVLRIKKMLRVMVLLVVVLSVSFWMR